MPDERIVLNDHDFTHLLNGGELVTDRGTRIVLGNIGWDVVLNIFHNTTSGVIPDRVGVVRKQGEDSD